MKILKTIPEDDMVLAFLRAELQSPRFASRYHQWLLQNNISEQVEIEAVDPAVRKRMLWASRPGLFKTLPKDIVWSEVLLDPEDWGQVMYINEEVWKSFSDGTRLVLKGQEKLSQPRHAVLAKRVSEITSQLRTGELLEKVILITQPGLEKLVLLEGHVRATAYVASGIYREKPIPAIVGLSEKATDWAWF